MSGVWIFDKGVFRLVEGSDSRKVLVHVPTNEVITSYSVLESKLSSLGWERYYNDPDLLQFHKRSTVHLISLPRDFSKFKSMHMFDIVVKNRGDVAIMMTWHCVSNWVSCMIDDMGFESEGGIDMSPNSAC
ncbi:hypothetical protein F0562_000606 [Nyssa sinensis]|uniref:Flowering-promoting factor 1-like protein 3 n=1 Tax=Nyssa sinensis TaxID=561372 RepID=A0A5J5C4V6_9ASTE|nr:hypothetical protein F0562_000606 [Nyssa sinensis]